MHGVDLDVLPEELEEGEEEMHGVDLDVLPEVEREEEKENGVQVDPSRTKFPPAEFEPNVSVILRLRLYPLIIQLHSWHFENKVRRLAILKVALPATRGIPGCHAATNLLPYIIQATKMGPT